MKNKLTITLKHSLTPSLEKEWVALWKSNEYRHYFNSLEWFKTCQKVFSSDQFVFVVAYRSDSLVGLMPLSVEKKYGVKLYTNPGGKYNDKSALLADYSDKSLISQITSYLKEMGSFSITEVDEELMNLFVDSKNLFIKESSKNFFLPFQDGPFAYFDKEQNRKIRKVLRENPDKFSLVLHRGSTKHLRVAIGIDSRSYRKQKGIGTFNNVENKKFFEVFIDSNRENVGINILYFDKKPIAYEIGVRCNNIYYGINKSFDIKYKNLFPGKILAYFLFQGLVDEGIQMFDFNRGDDQLKRSFTKFYKQQYDIYHIKPIHKRLWIGIIEEVRRFLVDWKFFYKTYRKVVSFAAI